MGNLNTHDYCEPESPCSTVVGTPDCRSLSYLDPRSPTLEIVRTPLEVPCARRSNLQRLISLLDPRSPSVLLNRTPLQVPCERAQPVVEIKSQELGLEVIDLGTINKDNEVSNDVKEELPTEHTDIKAARALFFGDMSMTASPVPSPAPELEPSPIKREEVLDSEEDIKTPETDVEEDAEIAAESQVDDFAPATKVPCIEKTVPKTKQACGAVKCMETSTPTVLTRRPGKENILQKQLFQTPDKARVRTPLSNVSGFHNSPLRR